jgi:hypothetical protein
MYAHESSDSLRFLAQRFARLTRTWIPQYLHQGQLDLYFKEQVRPKILPLRDELKNRIGAAIVEPSVPTLIMNPEEPATVENLMELADYFDALANQVPADLNPKRVAVDLWNVGDVTQKRNTFIGADMMLKAGKAGKITQEDNLMIAPSSSRNKDKSSTPPSPTPNKEASPP